MTINKKTVFIVSFALIFSTLGYFLNPGYEEYDLARHYAHIATLQGLSFKDVFSNAELGYLFFDSYAWLITTAGFSKHFFTASIVFLSYYLVLSVWKNFLQRVGDKYTRKTAVLVFTMFWLSIGFISIASGVRNGFGNSIVFYISYFLLFDNKRVLFLVGAFFAFLVHPFTLAPSFLVGMVYLFESKTTLKSSKLVIFLGFVFLFSGPLLHWVINYLQEILSTLPFVKTSYLEFSSQWGAGHKETRNFNGLLEVYLFSKLPVYVAACYLILIPSRKVIFHKLYFLLSILFLYFCIFYDFYTLVRRMVYVFIYFFTLFIVCQYMLSKSKINEIFFILYLSSLVIYSVFNVYAYRAFWLTAFI